MWNRTENQIELILVRHGETESNAEGRYLGRTDEGLSASGRKKILLRKEEGFYPKAGQIIVSPMKRCVETAGLLYPGQELHTVDAFREMDFGDFEGKNYSELNGNAEYQSFIDSGGELPFPGGESRAVFARRCVEGWRETLAFLGDRMRTEEDYTVTLVVHGGTVMALLESFGAGDYFSFSCENGGGYRCILTLLSSGDMRLTGLERLGPGNGNTKKRGCEAAQK